MQVLIQQFRNKIVNLIVENKKLQDSFDFSSGEIIQIGSKQIKCWDIQEWGHVMRMDGAWGNSLVLQSFSNITGITVHVVPTENLLLQDITHYAPRDGIVKGASIAIYHGSGHFRLLATANLPKEVTISTKETNVIEPIINLDEEEWPLPESKLPIKKADKSPQSMEYKVSSKTVASEAFFVKGKGKTNKKSKASPDSIIRDRLNNLAKTASNQILEFEIGQLVQVIIIVYLYCILGQTYYLLSRITLSVSVVKHICSIRQFLECFFYLELNLIFKKI